MRGRRLAQRRSAPGPRAGAHALPRRGRGFTLVEIMITLAVLGILAAIAVPAYQAYVVRAKITEGLNLVAKEKIAIAEFRASRNRLPQSFEELGWPPATGSAHGGDAASFQHVFGYDSEVWKDVEYQPKPGGWVLVLRSHQRPQWNNVELGLHIQIKATNAGVAFRCTVNQQPERLVYMPSTCRTGSVDDWDW